MTDVAGNVMRRIQRAKTGSVDHDDAVDVARRAGLVVNDVRKHGASWNGTDIRLWVPCRTALLVQQVRAERAMFFAYEQRPFARMTPIAWLPHRRREPETLIHDVAHWLVCPPSRRRIGDFGLGADPDMQSIPGYDLEAPEVVSSDYGNREEHRASILGILIEAALDGNARRRFHEHSWDYEDEDGTEREFDAAANWLFAHGHIDAAGNPKVMS